MVEKVHEYISLLQVTVSHYSRDKAPSRRYHVEPGMVTSKLFINYVDWLKIKYPGEKNVSLSKFNQLYTQCYNIVPRYVKCLMVLNKIFD